MIKKIFHQQDFELVFYKMFLLLKYLIQVLKYDELDSIIFQYLDYVQLKTKKTNQNIYEKVCKGTIQQNSQIQYNIQLYIVQKVFKYNIQYFFKFLRFLNNLHQNKIRKILLIGWRDNTFSYILSLIYTC
ncbi:hypothetical protein TTHERM_000225939 (macronuclear) [Tetrahymena thermophila SB210]|uniref:Uncharacterized protein n=1 Tax=Tetrahymena thermophila (strain SB210) TaxID=312017 RepID=W7XDK8_TETTS|nr:hypothetical protein TTHERM_000225939 [Tetrahymena thermophila SB210]EWS74728.1 hypothetical protein TTHERM_000225939 [Tetrahymena thermophila SB210]|eukprot:XP_012652729.1 hypothetical protein TTHERM_000225939 [Tetrahymena thermophila SB210]